MDDGTGTSPVAYEICMFAGLCGTATLRQVCRTTRNKTPQITNTTVGLRVEWYNITTVLIS